MEGFVFDLQRFADNYNWPYVLSVDFNGHNYYYVAEQDGDYWKIKNNAYTNVPADNLHYVRVYSNTASFYYETP